MKLKYVYAMLLLATQCKHYMDVKKELSKHLFHSSQPQTFQLLTGSHVDHNL